MQYQKLFAYFFLSISVFACSWEKEEVLPDNLRDLEIEVLDNQGNPVPQALVQLYESRFDLERREKARQSGISDRQGRAIFKNVEAKKYFVYTSYRKGDKYYDNQVTGDVQLQETPQIGQRNYFFALNDYKRPWQPHRLLVQDVNILESPTPLSLVDTQDSLIMVSPTYYIRFFQNDEAVHVGPLEMYQAELKGHPAQNIARSQSLFPNQLFTDITLLLNQGLPYQIYQEGHSLQAQPISYLKLDSLNFSNWHAYPDQLLLRSPEGTLFSIGVVWK